MGILTSGDDLEGQLLAVIRSVLAIPLNLRIQSFTLYFCMIGIGIILYLP